MSIANHPMSYDSAETGLASQTLYDSSAPQRSEVYLHPMPTLTASPQEMLADENQLKDTLQDPAEFYHRCYIKIISQILVDHGLCYPVGIAQLVCVIREEIMALEAKLAATQQERFELLMSRQEDIDKILQVRNTIDEYKSRKQTRTIDRTSDTLIKEFYAKMRYVIHLGQDSRGPQQRTTKAEKRDRRLCKLHRREKSLQFSLAERHTVLAQLRKIQEDLVDIWVDRAAEELSHLEEVLRKKISDSDNEEDVENINYYDRDSDGGETMEKMRPARSPSGPQDISGENEIIADKTSQTPIAASPPYEAVEQRYQNVADDNCAHAMHGSVMPPVANEIPPQHPEFISIDNSSSSRRYRAPTAKMVVTPIKSRSSRGPPHHLYLPKIHTPHRRAYCKPQSSFNKPNHPSTTSCHTMETSKHTSERNHTCT